MFTTTDPLGRIVTLTSKTWNIHIVSGHPELYKQEELVKRTIESPERILPDRDHENRENYFRLCSLPLPGASCLSVLKVVVDFSTSTGEINTAYTILNTTSQTSTKRGVIYERP